MDDTSKKTAWWQPAITMFLKLSVWVAVPVILALYLGQWLDQKYHTKPWLFLGCIGLAFIISMIGLIRSTLAEYKNIEQANKSDKRKY
jgi:F0F1-type ATP synthase assembly protein I